MQSKTVNCSRQFISPRNSGKCVSFIFIRLKINGLFYEFSSEIGKSAILSLFTHYSFLYMYFGFCRMLFIFIWIFSLFSVLLPVYTFHYLHPFQLFYPLMFSFFFPASFPLGGIH